MADELTQYGFKMGSLEVTRLIRMDDGHASVRVQTAHRRVDVYGSAAGRSLRVFSPAEGEWRPAAKVVEQARDAIIKELLAKGQQKAANIVRKAAL